MRRKARLPKSLLTLLIPLLLAACTPEPPLRIGTNQWPGYEFLYLARQLGAFDQTPVRLVELPSATEVAQYLHAGVLEGGALTLDETLRLIERGTDLVVVLVLDVSNGGDALVARPEIRELSELRGRRLGVELSAVGALMLEAVLDAAGLDSAELTLIPLTVDEQKAAYEQGRVDALITFEPILGELRAQGARKLFDSRQIPGRIVDVLAVSRKALRRHREGVEALIRGYLQALAYYRKRPEEACRGMAPRLQIPPELLCQSYEGLTLPGLEGNREWLGRGNSGLLVNARVLSALMQRKGLLRSTPQLELLADPSLLPAGETP